MKIRFNNFKNLYNIFSSDYDENFIVFSFVLA